MQPSAALENFSRSLDRATASLRPSASKSQPLVKTVTTLTKSTHPLDPLPLRLSPLLPRVVVLRRLLKRRIIFVDVEKRLATPCSFRLPPPPGPEREVALELVLRLPGAAMQRVALPLDKVRTGAVHDVLGEDLLDVEARVGRVVAVDGAGERDGVLVGVLSDERHREGRGASGGCARCCVSVCLVARDRC